MKPAVSLLLISLAAPTRLASAQEAERPPLTVFFADGASQPLRGWSLSWEYLVWPKGESPARGTTSRRESADLLVGKRTVPTAGLLLEVEYQGAVARGLRVVGKDGKSTPLKAEPPSSDLLAHRAGKDVSLQVRVLDLLGETLTGGKRSYCLMSFSALVQCEPDPPQRIVKIQFP